MQAPQSVLAGKFWCLRNGGGSFGSVLGNQGATLLCLYSQASENIYIV